MKRIYGGLSLAVNHNYIIPTLHVTRAKKFSIILFVLTKEYEVVGISMIMKFQ